MKKIVLSCLLFFGAVAISLAQQTPAEKFVTALSKKKNIWLVKNQYDSIQSVLDSRCVYIHSNGWIQNTAEVLDDMKSGKLVYRSIDIANTTARQFEKMVIVTGSGKFAGSMKDGAPFSMNLVFTEVYINRKSGWKLVSRHASKLPE